MSIDLNNLHLPNFTLERILPLLNKHTQQTAYTLKTVPKNSIIFQPYQNTNKVYLVKSGRVKVGVKNREEIELIHQVAWPSDVFGENALFQHQASNQFAQALEEVTYYEIDIQVLCSFWQQNRWLQNYILQLFAQNLQKAEQKLYDFIKKDTPIRIIEFLMEIVQERGEQKGVGFSIAPFFTQAEIAVILGCSVQSVSPVLRDLKKKSLVVCSKKRLVISNIHKLRFYRNQYNQNNKIIVQELQINVINRNKRKSA